MPWERQGFCVTATIGSKNELNHYVAGPSYRGLAVSLPHGNYVPLSDILIARNVKAVPIRFYSRADRGLLVH